MKRLTLAEARQQIEDRETWLWRQKHWGKSKVRDYDRERDFADEDYPGVGLEAAFWDIPNM